MEIGDWNGFAAHLDHNQQRDLNAWNTVLGTAQTRDEKRDTGAQETQRLV